MRQRRRKSLSLQAFKLMQYDVGFLYTPAQYILKNKLNLNQEFIKFIQAYYPHLQISNVGILYAF